MRGEQKDLDELLDQYIEQEGLHRLESEKGVKNLSRIVEALGYRNDYGNPLFTFLADNSGAIEAVIDWIKKQDLPEWREAVGDELADDQDEEDNEEEME